MVINNKDLIQSYILTTAKYDFSAYEKRILYRIVEVLQSMVKGKKLSYSYSVQSTLFDSNQFIIPLKSFLAKDDNNHKHVRDAFTSLSSKIIQFETKQFYRCAGVVFNVKIDKYSEFVTFYVADFIYDAFMNFSKGFSKFELSTAMQFNSIYSMRFYELLSEQKRPITYSVDKLKIMFNLTDQYTGRPADFIRKVVVPAQVELDAKSPYSFKFIPVKTGRMITSIKFYPVYLSSNRDPLIEAKKLRKSTSLRWDLDVLLINYLKENYIFSDDEIRSNLELFYTAQNSLEFDLLYFLSQQIRHAEKKSNPKGWIINAIKKQLSL